ncbi:hypothetical protein ACT691_17540 [Vibrio metschnikovii]
MFKKNFKRTVLAGLLLPTSISLAVASQLKDQEVPSFTPSVAVENHQTEQRYLCYLRACKQPAGLCG